MADDIHNCPISVVPQRIDQLLNGLMAAFKQVDTNTDSCFKRIDPRYDNLFQTLMNCWSPKACNQEYTKEKACDDAEKAVNEIISRAVHELEERIDNIVHEAAKYKIPQIINNMERARIYEDACSQQLICDALESLRNLNIEGLVNEAARLKLSNIKEYAQIEVDKITATANLYNVHTKQYDCGTVEVEEKHGLNEDGLEQVFVLGLLYAIAAYVLEEYYDKARDKDQALAVAVAQACGQS